MSENHQTMDWACSSYGKYTKCVQSIGEEETSWKMPAWKIEK